MTRRALVRFSCLWLVALACAPSAGPNDIARRDPTRAEVVVMGMIHAGHRTSASYGLDRVGDIVRRIAPDVVLAEIPSDRFTIASRQFEAEGVITEPRVKVFPEYTDVVFPLAKQLGYEIVPCAAWTQELNDKRGRLLAQWKTSRAQETAEVDAARRRMNAAIASAGGATPEVIHTDRYDRIVREGMEPYDRLFGDDLGAGGWSNINAGHWALIDAALDVHAAPGKRILIMFGAWHRHRIRDELRARADVVERPLAEFL